MRFWTLLLFLYFSKCIAAEVQTPLSVRTFYGGMQKLSQTSDANGAYYITKAMKECFYGIEQSVSGCPLPNDFRFFEYDKKNPSHKDGSLNSTTYVNRLNDYIYKEHALKVNYRILKNEYKGEQPDFLKGRMAVSQAFVITLIEKTYSLGGIKKIFNDTVYTDYSSGKISEIKNGNGVSLRVKAALAYQLKRYHEAYQCYEQIIAENARDADALYRIGLMTYYQQGCDFPRKTIARKKGREYMERAKIYGKRSSIGDKAENVLHNWKYTRI